MTGTFADAPVEHERKSDIQLKVTTYGGNPQGGTHDDERGSDPAGANSGRSDARDGATAR